ncbi:GntR family transcriptional regulator [Bradyrhizobium sp. LHD-71]|uniref:GntR family transcriptional regulator n=1 Tax=Bradyrhizobium sp. LHD-71 TaxID=3072141 RepID=UPI00280CDFE7|nr:GntR family transcriptional regulator [Bradyrhizobium sp. LHD-71]MDQ8728289.1 GntR family transcriptional regulator [Bradyrhizobium sp. LHD-71]
MSELLNSRVKAKSLVDTVTERLEAAIISGELAPGSRLSEQRLAISFGVSRGPLREAIRRLEGRQLLQRTANIGVHVTKLSWRDLTDLMLVREALEGMACRLAAEMMNPAELAELDQLLAEHGQLQDVQTGTGYYQQTRDFDFHFKIVTASRNERLIQMLCADMYDLLRIYRYRSSTFGGRAKAAYEEHRMILEALRSRDPDLSETAMRAHIRNSRLHIVKRLEELEASGNSQPAL